MKLVTSIFFTLAILSSSAFGYEVFSPKEFVSSSELRANGPHTLDMGIFGRFELISASSKNSPEKECKVHIRRFGQYLIEKGYFTGNGGLDPNAGGTVSVEIQEHICNEDGSSPFLCCYDSGTGCTVLVALPTNDDN